MDEDDRSMEADLHFLKHSIKDIEEADGELLDQIEGNWSPADEPTESDTGLEDWLIDEEQIMIDDKGDY